MAKPAFINLWNNYPTENSPCDGGYTNQCAIRMSLTLNGEGTVKVNRETYPGEKCSHGHARGAETLAWWLFKQVGRPSIYTTNLSQYKRLFGGSTWGAIQESPAKAKITIGSKKGILFFKDCFTREGESVRVGDHIDLWNAGITKTYDDPGNKSSMLWFWELS